MARFLRWWRRCFPEVRRYTAAELDRERWAARARQMLGI